MIEGEARLLDAEEIFRVAGQALYRAKESGRNRVEITTVGGPS